MSSYFPVLYFYDLMEANANYYSVKGLLEAGAFKVCFTFMQKSNPKTSAVLNVSMVFSPFFYVILG